MFASTTRPTDRAPIYKQSDDELHRAAINISTISQDATNE
jgi:hypothetical protein